MGGARTADPPPAANFQHPHAGRNQKRIDFGQTTLVVPARTLPALKIAGEFGPKSESCLGVRFKFGGVLGRNRRFRGRNCVHRGIQGGKLLVFHRLGCLAPSLGLVSWPMSTRTWRGGVARAKPYQSQFSLGVRSMWSMIRVLTESALRVAFRPTCFSSALSRTLAFGLLPGTSAGAVRSIS